MATTFVEYTGDGNATKQFTFPSYQESDVKVRVDGVLKTTSTHYNITSYTTTGGGNVVFTAGNIPSSPAKIRIYRDTNVDAAKATYTAGSSVKAADLNNNNTQLLYRAQEEQVPNLIQSYDIADQAIETSDIKDLAVTTAKIADSNVTTAKIADSNVTTAKIADNAVTMAKLNSGALPTDITVASANIVDGTIVEADIANSAVTSNKIADNAVTTTEILNGAVTTAKLAADAIDGTKLADNAVDSEHYTDGSIDRVHLEADIIDSTKLEDNAVNSEHYVDGSIDRVHLAADIVDDSKIADNAIGSEHIQANAVTDSEIATGTLDNRYFTETELTNGALDGRYFTETESDARYFNVSTGDTIKDGDTFPDNDTTIATTAAINDRIIDLVDDVGGFVPIANETSFPTANPDVNNGSGTLVSIKGISSTRTPSSGTVTIANGAGTGNTVTITGCGSTVLTAGFGVIVETTTTLHTYAFHRLVPKATEVTTVAGISSNITTVANNTANINAVAADASDIGIVAADGTDIGLVAGSISNVNTTAGSIANVNTVAGSISNVNSVGSNISNVNSVAGNESNINSAVSNASNINSAVSNASNINTVAGSISNVNTTAGSISNVNTVASNISSVNNFADQYRIGSSNPTTSLDTGDLFFNTSTNSLKVYTGSAWVDGVTQTGNFALKTGNTFTGSNIYNDNVKALFGGSSDLEIFHNTNSFIENNTNYLQINSTSAVFIKAGNEHCIDANHNGAVKLYYNNSAKFKTTSTGVTSMSTDAGAAQFGTVGTATSFAVTGQPELMVGGGATKDNAIGIESNTTAGLDYDSNLVLARSRGSYANKGIVQNNDFLGRVGFYGYDGAEYERAAEIAAIIDGTPGTNDMPTRLEFKTTQDGANVPTTRLKITNDGHVQIPADDKKLQIGANQDLEIFKDGNHVRIKDNQSANGYATCINSDHFRINDLGNTDNMARFIKDGAAFLFYDNSQKFHTRNNGVEVTGSAFIRAENATDSILLMYADDGDDHDDLWRLRATDSGSNFHLDNYASSSWETNIKAIGNGAVELYHNNIKTFETVANGIIAKGTEGADAFVYIFADEADDVADQYWLKTAADGTGLHIQNYVSGSSETNLRAVGNGAVELYYDNTKRLETDSNGATVTGRLTTTLLTTGGASTFGGSLIFDANNTYDIGQGGTRVRHIYLEQDLDISDNGEVRFGNLDDFKIFHNGVSNILQSSNGNIELTAGSEYMVKAIPNGAVELYHNNNKKLDTSSVGVNVTGNLSVNDGIMTITHTTPIINFEDNSPSNGNDFAIQVNGNQFKIVDTDNSSRMGFQFGSDGNTALGGNVTFNGDIRASADSTHSIGTNTVRFANGYFDTLYGDGSNLTGISSVGGSTGVDFNDNVNARFGTGNDLKIYHNGTDSYIDDVGTGNLKLRTNGPSVHIHQTNGEKMGRFNVNGSVQLYYDDSSKLETTSTGITLPTLGSEIRFLGSGVCDHSIQSPSGTNDVVFTANKSANNVTSSIIFKSSGSGGGTVSEKCRIDSSGHFRPGAHNTFDLGTSSLRWRNVFTTDLHLSNEGKTNDIDGTWGDWTIQEGEVDLFLKNNRSGKKYKFNLMEVS